MPARLRAAQAHARVEGRDCVTPDDVRAMAEPVLAHRIVVRGMYGKWLYRKSAADRIRKIRSEFPDEAQRKAVLAAQGGVSFAAVFGCFLLLMVIGSASTLLLGPTVDDLLNLGYT